MSERVWDDGRMKIGGDSENFLAVRLYYSRGYRGDPRGFYYLSVTPVRRVVRCGYAMLEYCPADGIKVFTGGPINRRSAKSDAAASEEGKAMLENLVCRVCEKNGIDRRDVGELIFA